MSSTRRQKQKKLDPDFMDPSSAESTPEPDLAEPASRDKPDRIILKISRGDPGEGADPSYGSKSKSKQKGSTYVVKRSKSRSSSRRVKVGGSEEGSSSPVDLTPTHAGPSSEPMDLLDDDDSQLLQAEDVMPQNKTDRRCALCHCRETSMLGQGDLTHCDPTSEFNPFKRKLQKRRSSFEPPDLSAHDSRGRTRGARSHGANGELDDVGHPNNVEVADVFESTGHVWAHFSCAAWSENVFQRDDLSLAGVDKAVFQGLQTRCSYCTKLGATVKCHVGKCSRIYHLPCVMAAWCYQDINNLVMHCPEHLGDVEKGNPASCNICEDVGDLSSQLFCTSCGHHYHAECVQYQLSWITPKLRAGWQCPDCKTCQTCREPGEDSKILICDGCDRGYHTFCLNPPIADVPKNGWRCKECRVCMDCASRNAGACSGSRWHHQYQLCEVCYTQRNKGAPCPACGKAYKLTAQKQAGKQVLPRCSSCRKYVHGECDEVPYNSTDNSQYICPVCRLQSPDGGQDDTDVGSTLEDSSIKDNDDSSFYPHDFDGDESMGGDWEGENSVSSMDVDYGLDRSTDDLSFEATRGYSVGKPGKPGKPGKGKPDAYYRSMGKPPLGKRSGGKKGNSRSRDSDSLFSPQRSVSSMGKRRKIMQRRSLSVEEKKKPKQRGRQRSELQMALALSREEAAERENNEDHHACLVLASSKDDFTLSQDMCQSCGSFGKGDEGQMVSCSQCGQCYHWYCAGISKLTDVMIRKGWRCLDCTVCEGCGQNTDEAKLLLCDDCDISYHIYCLDPPLAEIPQGSWRCKWCVKCVACQATTPGVHCEWQSNFTLCGSCYSNRRCHLCKQAYSTGEVIIRCFRCERNVHAICEGLSTENEYERACDNSFQCKTCREETGAPPPNLPPDDNEEVETEPPEPPKEYTLDGVTVLEAGLKLIKSLEVKAPEKKRVPRVKLKPPVTGALAASGLAGEGTSAAGLATLEEGEEQPKATPGAGDETDEVEESPSKPPGEEGAPATADPAATPQQPGKKQRPRPKFKPGVGGFVVKTRRPQRSSGGAGADDGVEDGKAKRRRGPKKRGMMEDTYPAFLIEAFMGKERIDTAGETEGIITLEESKPPAEEPVEQEEKRGSSIVLPPSVKEAKPSVHQSDVVLLPEQPLIGTTIHESDITDPDDLNILPGDLNIHDLHNVDLLGIFGDFGQFGQGSLMDVDQELEEGAASAGARDQEEPATSQAPAQPPPASQPSARPDEPAPGPSAAPTPGPSQERQENITDILNLGPDHVDNILCHQPSAAMAALPEICGDEMDILIEGLNMQEAFEQQGGLPPQPQAAASHPEELAPSLPPPQHPQAAMALMQHTSPQQHQQHPPRHVRPPPPPAVSQAAMGGAGAMMGMPPRHMMPPQRMMGPGPHMMPQASGTQFRMPPQQMMAQQVPPPGAMQQQPQQQQQRFSGPPPPRPSGPQQVSASHAAGGPPGFQDFADPNAMWSGGSQGGPPPPQQGGMPPPTPPVAGPPHAPQHVAQAPQMPPQPQQPPTPAPAAPAAPAPEAQQQPPPQPTPQGAVASASGSSQEVGEEAEGDDKLSSSQKNIIKWEKEEPLGENCTISPVLYCNINHPELKEQYPDWTERAKQIMKIWRKVPSDQKAPYLAKARENRTQSRGPKSKKSRASRAASGNQSPSVKSGSDTAPPTPGSGTPGIMETNPFTQPDPRIPPHPGMAHGSDGTPSHQSPRTPSTPQTPGPHFPLEDGQSPHHRQMFPGGGQPPVRYHPTPEMIPPSPKPQAGPGGIRTGVSPGSSRPSSGTPGGMEGSPAQTPGPPFTPLPPGVEETKPGEVPLQMQPQPQQPPQMLPQQQQQQIRMMTPQGPRMLSPQQMEWLRQQHQQQQKPGGPGGPRGVRPPLVRMSAEEMQQQQMFAQHQQQQARGPWPGPAGPPRQVRPQRWPGDVMTSQAPPTPVPASPTSGMPPHAMMRHRLSAGMGPAGMRPGMDLGHMPRDPFRMAFRFPRSPVPGSPMKEGMPRYPPAMMQRPPMDPSKVKMDDKSPEQQGIPAAGRGMPPGLVSPHMPQQMRMSQPILQQPGTPGLEQHPPPSPVQQQGQLRGRPGGSPIVSPAHPGSRSQTPGSRSSTPLDRQLSSPARAVTPGSMLQRQLSATPPIAVPSPGGEMLQQPPGHPGHQQPPQQRIVQVSHQQQQQYGVQPPQMPPQVDGEVESELEDWSDDDSDWELAQLDGPGDDKPEEDNANPDNGSNRNGVSTNGSSSVPPAEAPKLLQVPAMEAENLCATPPLPTEAPAATPASAPAVANAAVSVKTTVPVTSLKPVAAAAPVATTTPVATTNPAVNTQPMTGTTPVAGAASVAGTTGVAGSAPVAGINPVDAAAAPTTATAVGEPLKAPVVVPEAPVIAAPASQPVSVPQPPPTTFPRQPPKPVSVSVPSATPDNGTVLSRASAPAPPAVTSGSSQSQTPLIQSPVEPQRPVAAMAPSLGSSLPAPVAPPAAVTPPLVSSVTTAGVTVVTNPGITTQAGNSAASVVSFVAKTEGPKPVLTTRPEDMGSATPPLPMDTDPPQVQAVSSVPRPPQPIVSTVSPPTAVGPSPVISSVPAPRPNPAVVTVQQPGVFQPVVPNASSTSGPRVPAPSSVPAVVRNPAASNVSQATNIVPNQIPPRTLPQAQSHMPPNTSQASAPGGPVAAPNASVAPAVSTSAVSTPASTAAAPVTTIHSTMPAFQCGVGPIVPGEPKKKPRKQAQSSAASRNSVAGSQPRQSVPKSPQVKRPPGHPPQAGEPKVSLHGPGKPTQTSPKGAQVPLMHSQQPGMPPGMQLPPHQGNRPQMPLRLPSSVAAMPGQGNPQQMFPPRVHMQHQMMMRPPPSPGQHPQGPRGAPMFPPGGPRQMYPPGMMPPHMARVMTPMGMRMPEPMAAGMRPVQSPSPSRKSPGAQVTSPQLSEIPARPPSGMSTSSSQPQTPPHAVASRSSTPSMDDSLDEETLPPELEEELKKEMRSGDASKPFTSIGDLDRIIDDVLGRKQTVAYVGDGAKQQQVHPGQKLPMSKANLLADLVEQEKQEQMKRAEKGKYPTQPGMPAYYTGATAQPPPQQQGAGGDEANMFRPPQYGPPTPQRMPPASSAPQMVPPSSSPVAVVQGQPPQQLPQTPQQQQPQPQQQPARNQVVVPPPGAPGPAPGGAPPTNMAPLPEILGEERAEKQEMERQMVEKASRLEKDQQALEEVANKHRKTRKSLNARQRQAKKTGKEFSEADTAELAHVTQEAQGVQKQLEAARKQVRLHHSSINDYKQKLMEKYGRPWLGPYPPPAPPQTPRSNASANKNSGSGGGKASGGASGGGAAQRARLSRDQSKEYEEHMMKRLFERQPTVTVDDNNPFSDGYQQREHRQTWDQRPPHPPQQQQGAPPQGGQQPFMPPPSPAPQTEAPPRPPPHMMKIPPHASPRPGMPPQFGPMGEGNRPTFMHPDHALRVRQPFPMTSTEGGAPPPPYPRPQMFSEAEQEAGGPLVEGMGPVTSAPASSMSNQPPPPQGAPMMRPPGPLTAPGVMMTHPPRHKQVPMSPSRGVEYGPMRPPMGGMRPPGAPRMPPPGMQRPPHPYPSAMSQAAVSPGHAVQQQQAGAMVAGGYPGGAGMQRPPQSPQQPPMSRPHTPTSLRHPPPHMHQQQQPVPQSPQPHGPQQPGWGGMGLAKPGMPLDPHQQLQQQQQFMGGDGTQGERDDSNNELLKRLLSTPQQKKLAAQQLQQQQQQGARTPGGHPPPPPPHHPQKPPTTAPHPALENMLQDSGEDSVELTPDQQRQLAMIEKMPLTTDPSLPPPAAPGQDNKRKMGAPKQPKAGAKAAGDPKPPQQPQGGSETQATPGQDPIQPPAKKKGVKRPRAKAGEEGGEKPKKRQRKPKAQAQQPAAVVAEVATPAPLPPPPEKPKEVQPPVVTYDADLTRLRDRLRALSPLPVHDPTVNDSPVALPSAADGVFWASLLEKKLVGQLGFSKRGSLSMDMSPTLPSHRLADLQAEGSAASNSAGEAGGTVSPRSASPAAAVVKGDARKTPKPAAPDLIPSTTSLTPKGPQPSLPSPPLIGPSGDVVDRRSTRSPDSVVSCASWTERDRDLEGLVPEMLMQRLRDDLDDERDATSPPAPVFMPAPIKIEVKEEPSIKPLAVMDKENNLPMEVEKDIAALKSMSAQPFKQPSQIANMQPITLSLNATAGRDIPGTLRKLCHLLECPIPTSYKINGNLSPDVPRPGDRVLYHEERVSVAGLIRAKPRPCKKCHQEVAGLLAIRKRLSELSGIKPDKGEDEEMPFCSVACVTQFTEGLQALEAKQRELAAEAGEAWDPSMAATPLPPPKPAKPGKGRRRSADHAPKAQPPAKRWQALRWRKWDAEVATPKNPYSLPGHEQLRELQLCMRTLLRPGEDIEDARACCFCGEAGDSTTNGPGRLLNMDRDQWCHLNCALWSTEVYEAMNGTLYNVETAFKRSRNIDCAACRRNGATVGCFRGKCNGAYHVWCAQHDTCTFYHDKTILCHAHRTNYADQELRDLTVHRRVFVNRNEDKQIISTMQQEEQQHVIRIGALVVQDIGQLLPHQASSGSFNTPDYIYPPGFKSVRYYWSYRQVHQRCRYHCSIADKEGKPEFSISVQEEGFPQVTHAAESPRGVWLRVLEPLEKLRRAADLVKLFPTYLLGEDLFGLTDPYILKVVESLPGTELLEGYSFKYGRLTLIELPLVINPTGCARTEPRMRTLYKRPHTLHSTGCGRIPSTVSLVPDQNPTAYGKQFVHSKSQQYRKLKTDWKNNAYLARSRIQGLGLYAARDLEKHTMVIEYIGEVIRNEVANKRERMYEAMNRGVYMFRLDDDFVVDASVKGGSARYVNHSCAPNCVAEVVPFEKSAKIIIITIRRIARGEELCYDYKFDIEDDQHKIPCMCGAPNCKKWMN